MLLAQVETTMFVGQKLGPEAMAGVSLGSLVGNITGIGKVILSALLTATPVDLRPVADFWYALGF